ncbi:MAG: hypothetical protein WCQ54_12405 [Clostridiaceae bacterium]
MRIDFIDLAVIIIGYIVPLAAIVSLVIFVVRKLNSIEKKVIELGKLMNEMNKKSNE